MKHEHSDVGSASELARSLMRRQEAFGYFEPSMQHQHLPKCAQCNAVHPMARKPKIRSSTCPDCGAPVVVDAVSIDVPAVVTDWKFSIGNMLMRMGAKLNRFSKRI